VGQIITRALWLLRQIPLAGNAVNCSLDEHLQTTKELLAGIFWSMLPIWVGTFVAFIKAPALDWHLLRSAFSGTLGGGELFIYAAAFLAPICWIVHYTPPGAGEFPTGLAHTISIEENEFTTDNFKPGTSGEADLYHRLKERSRIEL
jgi:hypothetical protein